MSDGPSSNGRPRRPSLPRSAPIRTWSTLFGAPPGGARPQSGAGDEGQGAAEDPITGGVQLGYRVVEEHLKQAESFARLLRAPLASAAVPGAGLEGLTERMFQHAADLGAAWMEVVRSLAGPALASQRERPGPFPGSDAPASEGAVPSADDAAAAEPRAGSRSAATPVSSRPPAAPAAFAVALEVQSRRPVHTTVDLRPGAAGKQLVAHQLRTASGEGPRLGGVELVPDDGGGVVRIRLTVPADLPAGTYSGVIVDADSNLPQGMLAVTVED